MMKSIKGGMTACAGRCGDRWYGGVLVLDVGDEPFLAIDSDWSYDQRSEHARTWSAVTTNPLRKIVALRPTGNSIATTLIRAAERVEGPVCPREDLDTPILVWIEKRGRQWHLMCWDGTTTSSILSKNQIMRCPNVASTSDGLRFAYELDQGPSETAVEVVNRRGLILYATSGREPRLVSTHDGFALATEQVTTNRVAMKVEHFGVDADGPPSTAELSEGDYCINGDLAWTGEHLLIVAESCPALGMSNQLGLHRTLHVWQWDLTSETSPLGQLPVEEQAFGSIGAENMTPVRPTVCVEDGNPVVLFKQHRYTGFRAFGWDLFRCCWKDDAWQVPERISPDTMTLDSSFGLVCTGGDWLGLFPAHENVGGNGSQQSSNHRVDVITLNEEGLDTFKIPEDKRVDYRIPDSAKDIALEPPPLASPYGGRQLIWGDLHIHSIYSKCVAAVDSDPRENIRFARDVLGCRVFAITEHTPHTTGVESTWLYDQLESTAGQDNVILYATEPGIQNTRHMNLYSRDRDTFEKLERIILAHDRSYPDILRQLREDLPHDSVFIMRHVHGDAIPDAQIPQHFDPHFEVAMEAMQGRGNAMLEEVENSSIFPTPFLNAGCKIGLVGGTDHFREWAPNHFCLTGFWVKEVSADGVWEAIRNRHTIAMSNSRVAMLTHCQGHPMGSTVTLNTDEDFELDIHINCAHAVRRVCLIRDGELLPWQEVGALSATLTLSDTACTPGCHWYVATAEVDTGYGDTGVCHASPMFVWKKGEPREQ